MVMVLAGIAVGSTVVAASPEPEPDDTALCPASGTHRFGAATLIPQERASGQSAAIADRPALTATR
jgi:hypothetical protein